MLFNSYFFIFIFLPVTFLGYYLLGKNEKYGDIVSKVWLVLASLFFYGYWNINYLGIILSSILVNYFFAHFLSKTNKSKMIFILGLCFNLGLLGYFKYRNFFLGNINLISGADFHFERLILPLGISFFTLQQIAYLVDVYEGLAKKLSFYKYSLFVSFFPQLIAGPIVHYSEVMGQFDDKTKRKLNLDNISLGLFLFSIGLAKKVLLADTFSVWANEGFNTQEELHFFYAWGTSLSYTFQLYFDFSGYSDMAIGLGYLFNIKLPKNFNSPFKARNIIDFWTKWHITLSQFITTYIFTPLLRSMPKFSFGYSMISIFITMCIAGLWHGAAWTFVLYGALHGAVIVMNHTMKKKKKKLPKWLAIFLTFQFINIVFAIFRAETLESAFRIFKGMAGLTYFQIPKGILPKDTIKSLGAEVGQLMNNTENLNLVMILICLWIVFKKKNSMEMMDKFVGTNRLAILSGVIFTLSILGLSRVTDFIYFNF